MGGCVGKDRAIVEDKLDYKDGNVHVITTKEDWDQKIEEANKDGKIVSKLAICSRDYRNPLLLIVFGVCSTWCLSLSLCTMHTMRIGLRNTARYFHHPHFWPIK